MLRANLRATIVGLSVLFLSMQPTGQTTGQAMGGLVVNVDFDNGGAGPTYNGLGAAPDLVTNTHWTGVSVTGPTATSGALIQSDNATNTAITVVLGNLSGGFYQGGGGDLFIDYAFAFSPNIATFDLANVPAGNYDLYLYSKNGGANNGAKTQFTFGADSHIATPTASTAFSINENYVLFSGLSPDGTGHIQGTFQDLSIDHVGATLNGFQLVESVPEPGSLVIVCAGAMLLRRRR